MEAWVVANEEQQLLDMIWFGILAVNLCVELSCILSLERELTFELWPLFKVFCFVMIFDGIIVVNLSQLLHSGRDDFERDHTQTC